jgi:hypothetical protein
MEQQAIEQAQFDKRIQAILQRAKLVAREYYELTGRPLGVTAEIAEYEACRLLDLELAPVRHPGYDAIRRTATREDHIQIKGRCIPSTSRTGQRVGRIDLAGEWDAVLLVVLDEQFNATTIHEADRWAITQAVEAQGSRTRNRGQLGVRMFKSIGREVWSREQHQLDNDT